LGNKEDWIRRLIEGFIRYSPENTLRNKENDKAYEMPLVGFSKGNDPLCEFYKEDIGEFYLTPIEVFTKHFTEVDVDPQHLTIISWILPHNKKTILDNRKQSIYPSERWARARIYGEEVNNKLRNHVAAALRSRGFKGVAPMLSPIWKVYKQSRYGYASNWSERHAAYASGLGTFGLCDGLITQRGKAMRYGSVVANINLQATERTYDNHHAHCLFYSTGTCRKCMQRCPVGAISESGHDKGKCREHLQATKKFVKQNYGFEGYGCGMCQTDVPCESKFPVQ
jgi:epoxyqueuosine reductase